MKQLLLLACIAMPFFSLFGQTTYRLQLVAEGNFGTPNGDVFIRNTTVSPATNSTGMYQQANGTAGLDVLQDYKIAGNKAVLLSKGSGYSIVVTGYPSFTEQETFTGVGAPQTIGVASTTKAYVSVSNPDAIHCINLADNTLSTVSDAGTAINSYADYMVCAGGFVYAQIAATIVKIDTLTNAVVGTITPAVGSISGLVVDDAQQTVWVMGALNGTATLRSIAVGNDQLGTPISLTGVTTARNVRYYNGQVYFWASKNLHRYNIAMPNIPTSSVYLSALPGDNYSFGYTRAFDIDQATGDFVIGSANNYTAPSYFEVVDGTTFALIESGTMPGCAIVNNCVLETVHASSAGLAETTQPETLVYPNPATTTLSIQTTAAGEALTVELIDLLGNSVRSEALNSGNTTFGVESIPNGLYILKIRRADGTAVSATRVVVQH